MQRQFPQRAPAKITHIVDDNIEPPKTIDDRFDQLFAAPRIGNVGFDSDAVRAVGLQLPQGLLRRHLIGAIGNGHARTILRQPKSKPAADAPAPAGHQRHTITKRHSSPR